MLPKACLIMFLMPTKQQREERAPRRLARMGAGSTSEEGGRDAEDGLVLVTLGCFTQSRLVSDMHTHNLYISRTVISNTGTNKSNVQNLFSTFRKIQVFFIIQVFYLYYKTKKKQKKKTPQKSEPYTITSLETFNRILNFSTPFTI